MSYVWKQSDDKYQRIEAWRSSNDVYDLYSDGWFWDEKTKISVRFLPEEKDMELLIGDGKGSLKDVFIKLYVDNNKTPSDIFRQAVSNRKVLEREGLTYVDLLKASKVELWRSRREQYVKSYSQTLELLCEMWFRGG